MVFGLVLIAIAGVALLARFVPVTNRVVLVAAVLSPYLILGAPIAAVIFLVGHRWILAGVAVALTLTMVVVQLPWFVGSAPEQRAHVDLRILSANLTLGKVDVFVVVGSARAYADVLVVSELTENAVYRLALAGMDTYFPYKAIYPQEGTKGVGVWSKYPLRQTNLVAEDSLSLIGVRIQVPGVQTEPIVASLRIASPITSPIDVWRDGIRRTSTSMNEIAQAAGPGCVVVAGDFNSTPDIRQFRGLLQNGYSDAGEQVGARFAGTFPWILPFVTIDHVLTRQCSAASLWTLNVSGTDHRALVATVEVPR